MTLLFSGPREAVDAFDAATVSQDITPLTIASAEIIGIEYPTTDDPYYTLIVKSAVAPSDENDFVSYIEEKFDLIEM